MMKDAEVKQLEKEIKDLISRKIGKKYVCVLSFHNETKGDQITCTTMTLTNLNLNSDPFTLCNVLFIGLKGATEQWIGRAFGAMPVPKQQGTDSYHQ